MPTTGYARILVTSSIASLYGSPGYLPYTVSKLSSASRRGGGGQVIEYYKSQGLNPRDVGEAVYGIAIDPASPRPQYLIMGDDHWPTIIPLLCSVWGRAVLRARAARVGALGTGTIDGPY
ncbi:hypothetical protein KFL_006950050 [Klebsormidium nitens]|uniref:Uncharacterized protein n=1 Tax=Klebsormidium nitens TaxID=105231 RepID=A0A1Y1IJ13_KLENI|nr:hypothetical protein KFL_006950050 [Klebsormidium nitens]|eukprot:GAQ90870.1 hypothetical protein KFL_006950050 [Klebsormidium nitens]